MLSHPNTKGMASNPKIFISFNQDKFIFKPMHVHMNAWFTLLTSLYHSTYASMNVYFHVHVHGIQTNQNPNRHQKGKTSKTKQRNRDSRTYKIG